MKKHVVDPDRQKRREDLLRPNCNLGYDHDILGIHFLNIEAYDLAEKEFQRAIYLNPYEIRFKEHLAACFFMLKRNEEANDVIQNILIKDPTNIKANEILKLIKKI